MWQAIYHLAELGIVGDGMLPGCFGSRNRLTELNPGFPSSMRSRAMLASLLSDPSVLGDPAGHVSATASVPRAKPSASQV